MKIIAKLKCNECGKVWQISEDLRELSEDDIKCHGEYAEVLSFYRGEVGEDKLDTSNFKEKIRSEE